MRKDALALSCGSVRRSSAVVDRDQARREAVEAHEVAAQLQDQIEAMTAQQAEFMKTLASIPEEARLGKSWTSPSAA